MASYLSPSLNPSSMPKIILISNPFQRAEFSFGYKLLPDMSAGQIFSLMFGFFVDFGRSRVLLSLFKSPPPPFLFSSIQASKQTKRIWRKKRLLKMSKKQIEKARNLFQYSLKKYGCTDWNYYKRNLNQCSIACDSVVKSQTSTHDAYVLIHSQINKTSIQLWNFKPILFISKTYTIFVESLREMENNQSL